MMLRIWYFIFSKYKFILCMSFTLYKSTCSVRNVKEKSHWCFIFIFVNLWTCISCWKSLFVDKWHQYKIVSSNIRNKKRSMAIVCRVFHLPIHFRFLVLISFTVEIISYMKVLGNFSMSINKCKLVLIKTVVWRIFKGRPLSKNYSIFFQRGFSSPYK